MNENNNIIFFLTFKSHYYFFKDTYKLYDSYPYGRFCNFVWVTMWRVEGQQLRTTAAVKLSYHVGIIQNSKVKYRKLFFLGKWMQIN